MFGTSQTGGTHTSVQLHPIKLLILAAAMMLVGITMIVVDKIWAVPIGLPLVLLGCRLAYIAVRQIARGVRTFLS